MELKPLIFSLLRCIFWVDASVPSCRSNENVIEVSVMQAVVGPAACHGVLENGDEPRSVIGGLGPTT